MKTRTHSLEHFICSTKEGRVRISYAVNVDVEPNLKNKWEFFYSPFNPNSDENEISLCVITICSNIQVMRIKEVITKDKKSWYLDKFSLLVLQEIYEEQ